MKNQAGKGSMYRKTNMYKYYKNYNRIFVKKRISDNYELLDVFLKKLEELKMD